MDDVGLVGPGRDESGPVADQVVFGEADRVRIRLMPHIPSVHVNYGSASGIRAARHKSTSRSSSFLPLPVAVR